MDNLEQDKDQELLEQQLTEDCNGQNEKCKLCGAVSYYNFQKDHCEQAATCWTRWRTDCCRSLCSLLDSNEKAVKLLMANGDYCINCSTVVWDIHFTMTQIKKLKHRLRNLKAKVEDKIEYQLNKLEGPNIERAIQTTSEVETEMFSSLEDLKKVGANPDHHTKNPKFQIHCEAKSDSGNTNTDAVVAGPIHVVQIKEEPVDPDWCPGLDDISDFWLDLDSDSTPDLRDESDERDVMTPTPKKKRGRPRKDSSHPARLMTSGQGEILKRKRGRPKTKFAEADNRTKTKPDSTEVVVVDVLGGQEQKPKRGRPKKTVATNDDDPEFVLPESVSAVLKQHKKREKPKPCSVCSIVCQSKKEMSTHMAEEHPDFYFVCTICSGRYKRELLLELHIKNMHGGVVFPFHCSVCGQGFDTEVEVNQHEKVHNSANPFTCTICEKVFTNSLDLERHVLTHGHTFKCTHPGCERTFGSRNKFTRHVSHHNRPMVCETCGAAFRYQSLLATHMKTHDPNDRHMCHICSGSYKSIFNLKQHMKIHEGFRLFPCKVCGKDFMTPYHRKRHEEVHAGVRTYMCPTCGKRFQTKASLDTHESRVHEQDPVLKEKLRLQRQGQWKRYYDKRKLAKSSIKQSPSAKSNKSWINLSPIS